MRLRPLIVSTHLVLGLVGGLFVVLLGLTGSIMAFEPELEHLSHPKLFYVTPAGPAMSLAQVGDLVKRAYPHDTIGGYLLPKTPDLSYQLGLTHSVVFVDQYRGRILGALPDGPDWLSVVHQLHLRLGIRMTGDPGGKVVTGAAVIMLLMLVSGLYLWWPARRMRIAWRGAGEWRSWFDLHNVVGFFSLAFLLLLTGTGLVMGFEGPTTRLFYQMTGSQPTPRPRLRVTPVPGVTPIGPDSVVAIARAALPGAAPWIINVPEGNQPYAIRSRFPEDRTPGGRSFVFVDPYTGRVLFAEGSRGAPAGARAVTLNRAIHTGDILGIPSKAVMSLASLLAALQAVSGFLMWLQKKRRPSPDAAGMSAG